MPRSSNDQRDSRGRDSRGGRFQYRERSPEDTRRKANQSGGAFDSLFRSDIEVLSMKEGDYRLRILPPTWEGADDFGLEIFTHYGVGPDNQKYLCLNKMRNEPCPVCEARARAVATGDADEDYLRSLSASKGVIAWVIDREDRSGGPKLWRMPWSMDRDINKLSLDKETGRVLCVDHPEEGYDIEFTVTGTGIKTKYTATQIIHRSTPLSDNPDRADDWLDFVEANPLPEVLVYFDYDHINRQLTATARPDDDRDDDRRSSDRDDRRRARDDDDRGSRARSRDLDDEPEDERHPSGRRSAERSRDDRDPPPRSRSRHDDVPDDDPPPARERRRVRDEDPDDEPPPARSRSRHDDVPDDDPPPARERRRVRDEDPDDEPPPRSRSRHDDVPDDEPPPARSRSRHDDVPDDEPPPARERRRVRGDEDPDDEPPPAYGRVMGRTRDEDVDANANDDPPPRAAGGRRRIGDRDSDPEVDRVDPATRSRDQDEAGAERPTSLRDRVAAGRRRAT